jgi:hypothetical protein
MRNTLMAAVAVAALMLPSIASADPNAAGGAAAGAAVGAGTGFIIGGPVGAAIGAGVGGTVGAGTAPRDRDREVIVEQPARAPVSERTCTRDSMGNVVCQEIRR